MNIAVKLKDAPEGTELYSPIFGDVFLRLVSGDFISVHPGNPNCTHGFNKEGKFSEHGECMLFPSRDNRDWSNISIPKFKVGDTVMRNNSGTHVITKVDLDKYYLDNSDSLFIYIKEQVLWNKVIPKFDIATLHPFDKVLVRDDDNSVWRADFYSYLKKKLIIISDVWVLSIYNVFLIMMKLNIY